MGHGMAKACSELQLAIGCGAGGGGVGAPGLASYLALSDMVHQVIRSTMWLDSIHLWEGLIRIRYNYLPETPMDIVQYSSQGCAHLFLCCLYCYRPDIYAHVPSPLTRAPRTCAGAP